MGNKTWLVTGDKWILIDDPFYEGKPESWDWEEKEADARWEELGFSEKMTNHGSNENEAAVVIRNEWVSGACRRIYVEFWDPFNRLVLSFYVADPETFLKLLPQITMWNTLIDHGPIDLGHMETLIYRVFRAWHGHDSRDVCDECDPQEARYRRELQKEHRQKTGNLSK